MEGAVSYLASDIDMGPLNKNPTHNWISDPTMPNIGHTNVQKVSHFCVTTASNINHICNIVSLVHSAVKHSSNTANMLHMINVLFVCQVSTIRNLDKWKPKTTEHEVH